MRRILLASTILLGGPALAVAQPVSGPYVAGGLGANFRLPSKGIDSSFPAKVKSEDPGIVGVASLGWGFGNGVRMEIEGNFRTNEVRRLSLGSAAGNHAGGLLRTYGGMANGLYDFNGLVPMVTPYVGLGIGYGWSDWQKARSSGLGSNGQSQLRINDINGALAYQAILGVSYSLAALTPGLSLTAEARYFGTLDPAMHGAMSTTSPAGVTSTSYGKIKPSNDNLSALIGLRYAFNGPAPVAAPIAPPAPVVVPAPGVARSYLVFFDWNRADLTPRATEIIRLAAGNARSANLTRIEVSGHADRSGDAAYNQRLSQHRAEAVATALMGEGVARGNISIEAFGEGRPLVATADGVREPQNRRVEIVLR